MACMVCFDQPFENRSFLATSNSNQPAADKIAQKHFLLICRDSAQIRAQAPFPVVNIIAEPPATVIGHNALHHTPKELAEKVGDMLEAEVAEMKMLQSSQS